MKNKFLLILFLLLFISFLSVTCAIAQDITILFSGETHAMLYPCNCPIEPDGGIARRAALVKQLKHDNPDTLILDSGGFFAGGSQDEYSQNTALDMERARINLKAMDIMGYDAAAAGDDEFNFGVEFLEENMAKTHIALLSCNVTGTGPSAALYKPYIIKEVAGKNIGIIGVTGLFAKMKAGTLKFSEPKSAVKQAVSELKKKNVDIIVLLSHLGESDDIGLLQDVEGIDILIIGHSRAREEVFSSVKNTLIVRPSWEGRRLGEVTITGKDNKTASYKVKEIRLSDKIIDDPAISAILPRCFSDNNCKQEGMVGACVDAGTLKSSCLFTKPPEVKLLVITSKDCGVCNTHIATRYLKKLFPGLVTSYLYYPEKTADKITKDFDIRALPVFLLGKEAQKEKNFDNLKDNVQVKGDYYMLKAQFAGITYFYQRKPIKGRLDLFISLYDKDAPLLLDMIKDFNPVVHFLTLKKNKDNFEAKEGNLEVEEYLRSVCVQKYYPADFWNYISCRSKSIDSSWWQDCLGKFDTAKITACARGKEGKDLLEKNIAITKELQIMSGPTYLLNNQEIFGSHGVPKKEEFGKIINGASRDK